MPSGQILYLMMFVGKCSCTSHVLQYSSSRSYEHSRSLQSSLCPGVVTVLICSFFVAALLFVYINLKNGGKIIHIFTNRQTFSYLFCIFSRIITLAPHISQSRLLFMVLYWLEIANFATNTSSAISSLRALLRCLLISKKKRRIRMGAPHYIG